MAVCYFKFPFFSFYEFCCDAEEFECSSCVSMLSRGVGCAFFDDPWSYNVVIEGFFRSLLENFLELDCVVWREDKFFLVEAAFDSGVDVVDEEEVVADAYEGEVTFFEFLVKCNDVVKNFVPYFFDELVYFVEDDDKINVLPFEGIDECSVYFVCGKSCRGDRFSKFSAEFCKHAVFCVRDAFEFAVDVKDAERDIVFFCDGLNVLGDMFGNKCLPCSCFAVDENIARFFLSQAWCEDACDLVDLFCPVGNVFGGVIVL